MAQSNTSAASSQLLTLLVVVVVTATLKLAQEVLVPLALSVLFSFVLAPLVRRLESARLGRAAAVSIVGSLALAFVAVLGWTVAYQLTDLATKLPVYKNNIIRKLEPVQLAPRRVFGRASATLQELSTRLTRDVPHGETPPALRGKLPAAPEEQPVAVEIVGTRTSTIGFIREMLGPVLGPLANAMVVCVFTFVMLFKREDLRDRFLRLMGQGRLNVTTQALEETASRISRYLLMQLIVNAIYGLMIGIGLWTIGIPNASLWGLLTGILKFVPYLGTWIAAAMPASIAFAVFDSWTPLLLAVLLFLVVEFLTSNILEPWVYGSSTGLSPVAILVAALFWTWLWGVVGLLLATPLTVCLSVIGRYVPSLGFLNVLLGDQPVLPPHAHLYQRLLALDEAEATKLASKSLTENSLGFLYDSVIIPALCLVERDRHQGELDELRQEFAFQSIRELVDELGEGKTLDYPHITDADEDADEKPARDSAKGEAPPPPIITPAGSIRVLCVPARDDADEIVAIMLAQIAVNYKQEAVYIPVNTSTGEKVAEALRFKPDLVCISAVPPFAGVHARNLAKRFRESLPEAKIMIGIWTGRAESLENEAQAATPPPRPAAAGGNLFVSDITAAIEHIARASEPGDTDAKAGATDAKAGATDAKVSGTQAA